MPSENLENILPYDSEKRGSQKNIRSGQHEEETVAAVWSCVTNGEVPRTALMCAREGKRRRGQPRETWRPTVERELQDLGPRPPLLRVIEIAGES